MDMLDVCDPWCFDEPVILEANSNTVCPNVLSQRQALFDLYEASNHADGMNDENWGSGLPYKRWYGIFTSGSDVYVLNLANNSLCSWYAFPKDH
jgi:hypothetical protein